MSLVSPRLNGFSPDRIAARHQGGTLDAPARRRPGQRLLAALALAALLAGCATAPSARTHEPTARAMLPEPTAAAAIAAEDGGIERRHAVFMIDAKTGAVLADVDGDKPVYPASLTKMMTLYLTFEALETGALTLDQPLPVSAEAARQEPSKLGLKAGETITVEQAIRALVVKSANDVSVVLAEAQGGSVKAFAKKMNAAAATLGLAGTRFHNPHGLPDPRQVTTARDMVALAAALMRDHPGRFHYFDDQTMSYDGKTHKGHNNLLGRYDGADCCKTGYIRVAGFNLVASAERDGRRVIAAVFGGQTAAARDKTMTALLDRGFETLANENRRLVAGGPR